MNKNIFNNAIRDVKRSSNTYRSALKLDKKNVGKEFTEEIDFEKESLNLGEDLTISEENLNDKIKVTRLRSSIMTNPSIPYPSSSWEKKENSFTIKKYENNFTNYHLDIDNNISFPKRNSNLVVRKKNNQEIPLNNIDLSNTSTNWKHDKYYETPLLRYSVFIRNLPSHLNENKLREIFSLCGPILSLYVERDTAEIFYPRKDNALDAVKKYNHADLLGKKLKVSFYENIEEIKNEINIKDNSGTKHINLDLIREKRDPIISKIKLRNGENNFNN